MNKNHIKTEVPPAFGEVLIDKAINNVIESLGELSDEQKCKILAEKLVITRTVRDMCADHHAAKIIINIGENGDIIPEIHLKGTTAIKYLMKEEEK